ncbi:sporulation transcription factor Spo0A [Alkalicella caledoniensis]|uniref:Stage 0 sporulation protein A homolog n=1 Tax=Alkalicella caledoniensis TaxID=2731377 RepID=A0A7G9WBV8_ALKCA|nr:sporulation transcription factor Spo0A [Alkalicella caledoniensis]QNO16170.1 sporulation transcription factor Spo0A [Alkalicella caledoniensis]
MVRVFIADDNVDFCDMLNQFFSEQHDLEVVGIANNGIEALDAIGQCQPDVIVLDIIMPHLDGLGVLEKVKSMQLNPDPKVIILTAFGQERITKEALELGADYYVLKPFNMDVLVERIRQLNSSRVSLNRVLKSSQIPVKRDLEDVITGVLLEVGIPAHIKGYMFLKEAISLVINDMDIINSVTKHLYPSIAEKFDTTPSRVERAIRHAIESAWNGRNNMQAVSKFFRYSIRNDKGKPTNSEFIALLADNIRISQKEKIAN